MEKTERHLLLRGVMLLCALLPLWAMADNVDQQTGTIEGKFTWSYWNDFKTDTGVYWPNFDVQLTGIDTPTGTPQATIAYQLVKGNETVKNGNFTGDNFDGEKKLHSYVEVGELESGATYQMKITVTLHRQNLENEVFHVENITFTGKGKGEFSWENLRGRQWDGNFGADTGEMAVTVTTTEAGGHAVSFTVNDPGGPTERMNAAQDSYVRLLLQSVPAEIVNANHQTEGDKSFVVGSDGWQFTEGEGDNPNYWSYSLEGNEQLKQRFFSEENNTRLVTDLKFANAAISYYQYTATYTFDSANLMQKFELRFFTRKAKGEVSETVKGDGTYGISGLFKRGETLEGITGGAAWVTHKGTLRLTVSGYWKTQA